jgi:hypothetical protein
LQALAQRKIEELKGYKEWFEKMPKDADRAEGVRQLQETGSPIVRESIEQVLRKNIQINDADDMIIFDARPNSKIRSVLSMIGLPADIKNAVSSELQEIWARTPN